MRYQPSNKHVIMWKEQAMRMFICGRPSEYFINSVIMYRFETEARARSEALGVVNELSQRLQTLEVQVNELQRERSTLLDDRESRVRLWCATCHVSGRSIC